LYKEFTGLVLSELDKANCGDTCLPKITSEVIRY